MPRTIESKIVKTRKRHRCYGCLRSFPPGTLMTREVCIYDGNFSRSYFCETCISVLDTEDLGDIADGAISPGCVADEYPHLFEKKDGE